MKFYFKPLLLIRIGKYIMPDNPRNELSFTFKSLKSLTTRSINDLTNRLAERVDEHRKTSEDRHEMLINASNAIAKNIKLTKSVNKTTNQNLPDESEIPPFMINHANDKGQSIADLLGHNAPVEDLSGKDVSHINTLPDGTGLVEGISAKQSSKEINKVSPAAKAKAQAKEEEELAYQKAYDDAILLDKSKVKGLGAIIKERVFGQEPTIDAIMRVLRATALKLNVDENKPAGRYFFAGPSGVGKTELARTLAERLGVKLLKINMADYSQEQDVSKLTGAAAGLVGYEEGGILTNFVKKHPACVVLFDEIEKGHPKMDNILLSILDDGTCATNDGKEIKFGKTIVICTSNLGATVEYRTDLTKEEKDKERMKAIKKRLNPEVIARFNDIFHFNSLIPEIYKLIVNKFTAKVTEKVEKNHPFKLSFSPKITDFIVEKSYDPALGGRPAEAFIADIVMEPLSEFMLDDNFDDLIPSHPEITLDLNNKGKVFIRGKNKKILGVLENTEELVAAKEAKKFTNDEPKEEVKSVRSYRP